MSVQEREHQDVELEATVCAASRPSVGVVIVEDNSGVELLEVGDWGRALRPGDRIRIQGHDCLLRKRETGIEISAMPVVNNDGTHRQQTLTGEVSLTAGLIPLRLDWFNGQGPFHLGVSYSTSNRLAQSMESSNLWHLAVDALGRTNLLPGLRAECYEDYWIAVPDFDLLRPAKTGVTTNLDLAFRTCDEMVGIRYTGFFKAPCSGRYRFDLSSDDGSLLFLNHPEVPIEPTGAGQPPEPSRGFHSAAFTNLTERRWITVEGHVTFVSRRGTGLAFELQSDRNVISVWLADAAGLDSARLLNARVQVTGAGRGVITADQRIVLGRLFAANAQELVVNETTAGQTPFLMTSVAQVQSLPIEAARRGLPVRIRGVVTSAKHNLNEHWMSIQDETRGIFVSLHSVTSGVPALGEFWEVQGHSGAGDFAPVVIADNIVLLGDGRLPEPVRPTWIELLNGSLDVQWAEIQGLVTKVHSNNLSLWLPEGLLEVQVDGRNETQLKPFEKSVVRVRGVLYATWDAQTREVRVGRVMMRNAEINVDTPAPLNPFEAVEKTPRELLLFDTHATPYRPVKVRGQILYADATQIFLEGAGTGLRLLPSDQTDLHPGDLVEAVGYPDFSRTAVQLREVLVQETGQAALPVAPKLTAAGFLSEGLDSTRVQIEGQLMGWHYEQAVQVLEMESAKQLFLARLPAGIPAHLNLRAGSRLALAGVYVGSGRQADHNFGAGSFELLLNSLEDIVVLAQPPWWTLQRLLLVVALLLAVLAVGVIWIRQLRRLVVQRTIQLQQEIRERARVEQERALETERARIAQDLHDDLGSSLTEIAVLASKGLRADGREQAVPGLFQAITGKARELVAALDIIVWAVDPKDNSLQSVADYLCDFADEFLSPSGIACRFDVPVALPAIVLDGHRRHGVFLAVKETLNNIVRHAAATEVEFRLAVDKARLEIVIVDNGAGFDANSPPPGKGLASLPLRLAQVGGSYAIESIAGKGTSVTIDLRLSGQNWPGQP